MMYTVWFCTRGGRAAIVGRGRVSYGDRTERDHPEQGVDVTSLERDLHAVVRGGVRFDALTRTAYATDASIYEIEPIGVVTPLDDDDVRAAVGAARRHGAAILPRGGGTSLGGQSVGHALVIDFSAHMDGILEIDVGARRARVQPGVVRDRLNAALAPTGLHLSPDPATGNRANVGGMIGNNSSGTRSLVHGKMIDHVLGARVLLYDGTEMTLGPEPSDAFRAPDGAGREAEIRGAFHALVTANADEIRSRYPKVMRRVAGYPLDAFVDTDEWNLARLFTGSEGTLGVLLEATVNLDPVPAAKSLVIAHFDSRGDAIGAVPEFLTHGPSAVEILDSHFVGLALSHPTIAPRCAFLEGSPDAVLIVEFYADSTAEAEARAHDFASAIGERMHCRRLIPITDAAGQAEVWSVRKDGLGIMLTYEGERKPIAFIEDSAVPVDHLAAYVDEVVALCRRLGVDVAMYAHASVGVIHVRPILDLKEPADIQRMVTISEETLALVMKYGGAWSGEHGDGLVRSPRLEAFFGPRVYGLLRDVKRLFDPDGKMNPGKIVDAEPMDRHLRYGADYPRGEIATHFRFRDGGGVRAAVELCTGVGACRKVGPGTMCPSYIATRNEIDSTRGRANALRRAMVGRLGMAGLGDPSLDAALDLCLSCKACKSECPSRVDMARLKSEALQARYDARGVPRQVRAVGASMDVARMLSGPFASIANAAMANPVGRRMATWLAGVDPRRPLPRYASETLERWVARRGPGFLSPRRITLFGDCTINYHEPHVGREAVHLLEALGFAVDLLAGHCCQRPRISNGLLRDAAARGRATLSAMEAALDSDGTMIAVCEPSCLSALVDDLPDLMDDVGLARRLADRVRPIESIAADYVASAPRGFVTDADEILLHGHCHQKALYGTGDLVRFFASVSAASGEGPVRVRDLDAGCCGMAGAFGYDHVDISMRIGEDRLFPALRERAPGAVVVAPGFSCRHQIADGVGVESRHWVTCVRERD